MMKGGDGPTNSCRTYVNWGAFDHASHAPQLSLTTVVCTTPPAFHLMIPRKDAQCHGFLCPNNCESFPWYGVLSLTFTHSWQSSPVASCHDVVLPGNHCYWNSHIVNYMSCLHTSCIYVHIHDSVMFTSCTCMWWADPCIYLGGKARVLMRVCTWNSLKHAV